MWENSMIKAWKDHGLECVLMLVITLMGFYIIGIEVKYTGGFQLIHAIVTGFFGVMTIVYPVATALKDYLDLTTHSGEKNNGEV